MSNLNNLNLTVYDGPDPAPAPIVVARKNLFGMTIITVLFVLIFLPLLLNKKINSKLNKLNKILIIIILCMIVVIEIAGIIKYIRSF